MSSRDSLEMNKALIRRVYDEGYSRGDESVYAACYCDDFLHHDKTIHDVGKGAEAERLSMLRFRDAVPDARFEVVHQIAEGDRVVNQLRITGNPVKPFPPIEPGTPMAFGAVAIFRIREGKIAEEWFYRASGTSEA
jgi:predicted ester cyclase